MTGLVVHKLTVKRAGRPILDNVSFTCPSQGLVGLLGPNGAGKSTLARLLAGQPGAHAGAIRMGEEDVTALSAARRAAMIGYMPQAFTPHWDISPRMLVEMGTARRPDLPPGMVRSALSEAGLGGHADRLWSTLSGGEKARALFAAVTVADPAILVVDEPGASLDIGHRIRLMRRLAERGRTRLVVAALHDIELATAWCDRLVVMDQGRLVAVDTAGAVVRSGILAAVFGVAFETLVSGGVTIARPVCGRD